MFILIIIFIKTKIFTKKFGNKGNLIIDKKINNKNILLFFVNKRKLVFLLENNKIKIKSKINIMKYK